MGHGHPDFSLHIKPFWYDRNPASKLNAYNNDSVAPHADVQRISYTCPTDKKAMVEVLVSHLMRRTAATTVGEAEAYWRVTAFGETTKLLLIAKVFTNNVGDKDVISVGTTMTMFDGDVIAARTFDNSTGGLMAYSLCYKLTEFDE